MADDRFTIVGAVAIILAAILSGSFLTTVNPIFNRPSLAVNVIPGQMSSNITSFEFTNSGFTPASNITMIVIAPQQIESAFVNLTTTKIGNLSWSANRAQVTIPKMIEGGGSIVKLDLSLAEKVKDPSYIFYITYDQGSERLTGSTGYATSGLSSDFLLIFIVETVLLGGSIPIFLAFRRRNKINGLTESLLTIRRELLSDPNYDRLFYSSWRFESSTLLRTIKDPREMALLDDLRQLLLTREKALEANPRNMPNVSNLNAQILTLAEQALGRIDWSRLMSFKIL